MQLVNASNTNKNDTEKKPVIRGKFGDPQIHKNFSCEGWFLSLKNGVIILNPDGTWEWEER